MTGVPFTDGREDTRPKRDERPADRQLWRQCEACPSILPPGTSGNYCPECWPYFEADDD